jgi:Rrf2 family nitric oxide-sensitive transcriptional repressor
VQSFLTELDNYTLADLVEENQPLYKLLLVVMKSKVASRRQLSESPGAYKLVGAKAANKEAS